MIKTYTNPEYPYRRSPDQDSSTPAHHPVVIVGAGPAGLAAALDFAMQGVATVVLDDNNTVSVGSRAICFAKRTLEIADRYGCGESMVNKGITWNLGKVFFKDRPIYEFNLLPEQHHKLPAFINLQQYYFEEYMVDRIADFEPIDLRWRHKVTDVRSDDDGAQISVTTEDGDYQLRCDYLLVADGANSPIRTQLGLESKGQVFADRFLIADVVMKADFPTERWLWFDPPFHLNQSTLLHRQADDVWRIDFQLGWDADPDEEKKPENVIPRVQAMLGAGVEFELEWASVYTFQCRKMDSFIQQRVVFIGDAAHQVSPFGARGANGALQSVENLAWKIAHILREQAPPTLLGTYDDERLMGANENILNSTRATDFITPKNHISRVFRDATLELAEHYPFARALVNSGR
ncbi:MAG: FAD-dependent monooxygenase, partial [Pseudomonadales bacterium]